jgi:hypothetical protein
MLMSRIAFFGTLSEHEPWGFSLYGHYLCFNIFIVQRQMVISPVFVGVKPNIIDAGPQLSLTLCWREGALGLQLMQTLPTDLQQQAQIYAKMEDESMPPGRWHPADEVNMRKRPAAHTYTDTEAETLVRGVPGQPSNPYRGVRATSLPAEDQELLLRTVEAFLVLLPPGPLAAHMRRIRQRLDETFFSWIGGFRDEDPFYYRIQSPIIVVEFDHHRGVWLLNKEPAKYHIHTLIRTPNGNDYGRELLRQIQARSKVN